MVFLSLFRRAKRPQRDEHAVDNDVDDVKDDYDEEDEKRK
jgi:hypothetical protein